MAAASDIVFICVTGSREVEAIIRGPGGLKEGLKKGSVVVDCSTSDPVSTVALAAELAAIGVDFVDAPLSRTPKEAWEGTLDAMVGAPDALLPASSRSSKPGPGASSISATPATATA